VSALFLLAYDCMMHDVLLCDVVECGAHNIPEFGMRCIERHICPQLRVLRDSSSTLRWNVLSLLVCAHGSFLPILPAYSALHQSTILSPLDVIVGSSTGTWTVDPTLLV
jgi:hypothetical protein